LSGLPYPPHEALLKTVRWYHSGDALEAMYVLLVNGVETIEFDDWPSEWGRLPKP
jgi:hypothetical protein